VHIIASEDRFGCRNFYGKTVNHEQGILKLALEPAFGVRWNSLRSVLPVMFGSLPASRDTVVLLWKRFVQRTPQDIQY
jgi:hypothetical protein